MSEEREREREREKKEAVRVIKGRDNGREKSTTKAFRREDFRRFRSRHEEKEITRLPRFRPSPRCERLFTGHVSSLFDLRDGSFAAPLSGNTTAEKTTIQSAFVELFNLLVSPGGFQAKYSPSHRLVAISLHYLLHLVLVGIIEIHFLIQLARVRLIRHDFSVYIVAP